MKYWLSYSPVLISKDTDVGKSCYIWQFKLLQVDFKLYGSAHFLLHIQVSNSAISKLTHQSLGKVIVCYVHGWACGYR